MHSAVLTLPGLWAQWSEKKRRWGGGWELPDACREQRFVLDCLQWGQHSGLWAFYGHCAFTKMGFRSEWKLIKWDRRYEEELTWNTSAIFKQKWRKQLRDWCFLLTGQVGEKKSVFFGPLYLLVIIRSVCCESKTLCFFFLNLYFLIFHGTGL